MSFRFDDHHYLFELIPFIHEPLRPARQGCIGEIVYAQQWRDFMGTLPHPDAPHSARLADILHHMPEQLTQRHASVAASFVCWLGTNCGLGFLWEAKRAAKEQPRNVERAWMGAWAWQNKRLTWLSGGIRTVEHILAPKDLEVEGDRFWLGALSRLPDVSSSDFEVFEHVVCWMATIDGARFLAHCEVEVELARKTEQERARRAREIAQ